MSKIKDFLKSPLGTALCAAAACLLAVVLVWLAAVRPNNDKSLSERISDDYSQYSAELDEANGAAQTFDTDNDLLAMAFVFGTSNGQPTGELHLELADADTGEVLARSTGDMANIVAGQYTGMGLDTPVTGSAGRHYRVTLKPEYTGSGRLTVGCSNGAVLWNDTFTVNGEAVDGTLALLVPGLLEGTTTIGELLTHGDTGIGTGEGLDGELIILDGVAYKVGQSGVAERVPDDFTMPFANVHHAAFQYQCERRDIGLEDLNNRIVEANGRANTFFSVIVRGTFSFIKTRAVIKQQAPYPTLVEVADRQAMFLRHDVKGTMLGYFSPEMFHGAAVAGFHEHFLSDDRTFGGHVLDAVLDHGKIYSQVFDTLVQHLPVDDPEYRNHDFRHDPIAEAITAAEGDKAGN